MTTGYELLERKRPRGRKWIVMLDDIKDGKTYDKLKEKALDREEWKKCHRRPAFKQST